MSGPVAAGPKWHQLTPRGDRWTLARGRVEGPRLLVQPQEKEEWGGVGLGAGKRPAGLGLREDTVLALAPVALVPQRCGKVGWMGPDSYSRAERGSCLGTAGCWQLGREQASPLSEAISGAGGKPTSDEIVTKETGETEPSSGQQGAAGRGEGRASCKPQGLRRELSPDLSPE